MTKTLISLAALCGLISVIALPGIAGAQDAEKALSGLELKTMVQNLGLEVKDLNTEPGKEKFEFLIQKDGFDVWLAGEVSASKRFVWLTAFLGTTDKIADFNSRAAKVLQANAAIQPSQFYTTDQGNFYMALPVDNRNITPALLKHRVEKLAADVAATSDLWKP